MTKSQPTVRFFGAHLAYNASFHALRSRQVEAARVGRCAFCGLRFARVPWKWTQADFASQIIGAMYSSVDYTTTQSWIGPCRLACDPW